MQNVKGHDFRFWYSLFLCTEAVWNGIGQASSSANPFTKKLKTEDEGPSDFKESGLKVYIAGPNHGKANPSTTKLKTEDKGPSDFKGNPFITKMKTEDEGPSDLKANPSTTKLKTEDEDPSDFNGNPFTTKLKTEDEGPSDLKANPSTTKLKTEDEGPSDFKGNPFTTKLKTEDEGPSDLKVPSATMTFAELGLKVNIAGPNHGKGPFITPNANDAGPSEPCHTTGDNEAPYVTLGEMDLLGGRWLDMKLNHFEDRSYDYVKQTNPFITPNANDAGLSMSHCAPDDNEAPYLTLIEMNLLGDHGIFDAKNEPN